MLICKETTVNWLEMEALRMIEKIRRKSCRQDLVVEQM